MAVSVLVLCGSSRAAGNTFDISNHIAARVRRRGGEAKVAALSEHAIDPVGGCGDCNWRDAPCDRPGGIHRVLEMMEAADALIYAAPVHGFGLCHVMQRFIERAGVCFLRHERPLRNKVGGAVVIGRRYSQMDVYGQLLNNLFLNRLILPGSGYPPIVFAGKPGEALKDAEGLAATNEMVDRVFDLAELLAGRQDRPAAASLPDGTLNERIAADSAA